MLFFKISSVCCNLTTLSDVLHELTLLPVSPLANLTVCCVQTTAALTAGLERIPDQLGYLVISEDGVLAVSPSTPESAQLCAVLMSSSFPLDSDSMGLQSGLSPSESPHKISCDQKIKLFGCENVVFACISPTGSDCLNG